MYLERLQQGLLGAMQAQNNPSAFLAQQQQNRQMQQQQNEQMNAQALQQAKANQAQMASNQRAMEQTGQQMLQEQQAREERAKQMALQIGLAVATGGAGGGGEAAEAAAPAAESAGQAAIEDMAAQSGAQLEKGLLNSGAMSDTAVKSAELGKMANLGDVNPYKISASVPKFDGSHLAEMSSLDELGIAKDFLMSNGLLSGNSYNQYYQNRRRGM